MAISDERLSASLRRSEARRAASRRRREQQQRLAWMSGGALLSLLLVCTAAVSVRRHAPPPPVLIVVWPWQKLHQRMADGSYLLVRRGQPFTVTVDHPDGWELDWDAGDVRTAGPKTEWSPTGDTSTLVVSCRKVATGWQHLIAWLWPMRRLLLHGVVPAPLDRFRIKVSPDANPIWVFPLILATRPLACDERALPLLVKAVPPLVTKPGEGPSAPLWTLAPSFDDKPDPDDTGTSAVLSVPHADESLSRVARYLARWAPAASIKLMAWLDRQPTAGIVRIAFDGKGERGGWVLKPDGRAVLPLEWWTQPLRAAASHTPLRAAGETPIKFTVLIDHPRPGNRTRLAAATAWRSRQPVSDKPAGVLTPAGPCRLCYNGCREVIANRLPGRPGGGLAIRPPGPCQTRRYESRASRHQPAEAGRFIALRGGQNEVSDKAPKTPYAARPQEGVEWKPCPDEEGIETSPGIVHHGHDTLVETMP